MSETHPHDFDPRLLDLHLGHLSLAEQTELRCLIANDPALAAQDEALAGVFRALQAPREEPFPSDLPSRIAVRVVAAGPPPRVIRASDERPAATGQTLGSIIRFQSLRDVVAIAALIVLAVGVGVPGLMHMRERQHRMGCSWNLAQLGGGVQQYASVFNGQLPFAGWGKQHTWQPSNAPGVVSVPNRQHVYPLLQLAYITEPRLFVCPSRHDVPMPQSEIQRRSDFLEARNVSYAYQNMAGVRPSVGDDPRLPILADDNPLFDDGLPLFDAWRLPGGDPASANSRAHRRAGQNILTLDGHVRWTTTPLCGIDGDNIWILLDVTEYTGREGPTTATDSHLLK